MVPPLATTLDLLRVSLAFDLLFVSHDTCRSASAEQPSVSLLFSSLLGTSTFCLDPQHSPPQLFERYPILPQSPHDNLSYPIGGCFSGCLCAPILSSLPAAFVLGSSKTSAPSSYACFSGSIIVQLSYYQPASEKMPLYQKTNNSYITADATTLTTINASIW